MGDRGRKWKERERKVEQLFCFRRRNLIAFNFSLWVGRQFERGGVGVGRENGRNSAWKKKMQRNI